MPWVKIVFLQVRFSFFSPPDVVSCVAHSSFLFSLLMSEPWNHLLFGVVGGYVGYNYKSWEASLLAKVNEKRVLRGMAPMDRKSMA